MKGAKDYASMFRSGQYGKLYLISGSHARGKTFQIYILPSEEKINKMPRAVKGAVEVYGAVCGQLGWNEQYGWLHRGKWEDDFNKLVEVRNLEITDSLAAIEAAKAEKVSSDKASLQSLLEAY